MLEHLLEVRDITFGSTPLFAVRAFAWLAEKFSANPPLTRDMLEILEQDDLIDSPPGVQDARHQAHAARRRPVRRLR